MWRCRFPVAGSPAWLARGFSDQPLRSIFRGVFIGRGGFFFLICETFSKSRTVADYGPYFRFRQCANSTPLLPKTEFPSETCNTRSSCWHWPKCCGGAQPIHPHHPQTPWRSKLLLVAFCARLDAKRAHPVGGMRPDSHAGELATSSTPPVSRRRVISGNQSLKSSSLPPRPFPS
jgi:hypothetical protein